MIYLLENIYLMIVNNLPRGGGGGNRRSLSQFGERAESLGKSGAKLMPRT
jgi:hypothetical protein